ncbi:MAG: nucleotidyl transferase AbiEii/AbiGii toxin family protein [Candidatus Sumerlaeia bacterium]|nr:nucleotidyl transferase AbiEii/AbiGii toxin family protein [Candidatus Sumerlaeia bacterium]
MEPKPRQAGGYQPESVFRVRRTLLFVASKLGDLMEEIVVVGGLVPYLLVQQQALPGPRRHVGTMDLDLGLSLAILDDGRYQEIAERLRAEGFRAEQKSGGRIHRQTWVVGNDAEKIRVDFLIQPNSKQSRPGRVTNIEHDLAAITVEGLDLAFRGQRKILVTDQMPNGTTLTRGVNVAAPGAFVVLKAIAFHQRGENKDAYDLFYILREVDRVELQADFRMFPPGHPAATRALQLLHQDFIASDAGRAQVAEFIEGRRNDAIESDVLAHVTTFLRSVG